MDQSSELRNCSASGRPEDWPAPGIRTRYLEQRVAPQACVRLLQRMAQPHPPPRTSSITDSSKASVSRCVRLTPDSIDWPFLEGKGVNPGQDGSIERKKPRYRKNSGAFDLVPER